MNDVRTKIGDGGRVIIPAIFRQAIHLESGNDIIFHLDSNEIYITTPEQAHLKLQTKVKSCLDKMDTAISLGGELISTRREEAKRER